MKSKIFTLLTLALFLSVAMVSAASLTHDTIVLPDPITHDQGTFEITFDLINAGEEATIDWSETFTSGSAVFTYSTDTIADGTGDVVTETITVSATFDSNQVGPIEGSITADPSGAGDDEVIMFSIDILEAKELSLTDATLADGETSIDLTLTNEGNTELDNIEFTFSTLTGVTLEADTITTLAAGETKPVTITVDTTDFNLASAEVTVTATADDTTTETIAILTVEKTIEPTEELLLCTIDNEEVAPGSLRIKIDDIRVEEGFGDNDNFWYIFDKIEIDFEIENKNNDEKINDIEVEWGIWSNDLNEWVLELDDEKEFDLKKDGDDKLITVSFSIDDKLDVDLEDLEEEDLVLIVSAIGEEQVDVGDEFQVCAIASEEIELMIDSDFVLIREIMAIFIMFNLLY